MNDLEHGRRCDACAAPLAQDNTGGRCGRCQVAGRTNPVGPPELPVTFWQDERLQEALRRRHIGQVIRAYRGHWHHGRRGIAQEEVAAWADMSQGQLSRIETGPALMHLDRLIYWARLLRIPEEVLWFRLPVEPGAEAEVVASDLTAPPGQAAKLLDGIPPTPVPARVGPREVDQLRRAAGFFEGWDFAYGGGVVREAVMAQLRWSTALLDTSCDRAQRGELFSAVGYLAHTCAFMAFDDLAYDDARRMWRLALSCAEEAEDWPLRAAVLSAMARQAMWIGQHDDSLTFAELALVRSDRLTKPEQTKLYATRARVLAVMHRPEGALAALDDADAHFADMSAVDVPPWMDYYDEAEHAGDTGHALADLVATGRPSEPAVERLTAAIDGHTPGFARSQALCQAKLATLAMAVGDPCEASELGHRAVELSRPIHSRRLAHYLGELADETRKHTAVPDVAALRQSLATVRSG